MGNGINAKNQSVNYNFGSLKLVKNSSNVTFDNFFPNENIDNNSVVTISPLNDNTTEISTGPHQVKDNEIFKKLIHGSRATLVTVTGAYVTYISMKKYSDDQGVKSAMSVSSTLAKKGLNIGKSKVTDKFIIANPLSKADTFAKEYANDFMDGLKNDAALEQDPFKKEFLQELSQDKEIKKEMYDSYKAAYMDATHSYNVAEKQMAELTKAMKNEINLANGDQTKIANIQQKYQPELDKLEQQKATALKTIAGDGDVNKVKVEKEFMGMTQSQIASYGSQSVWVAVVSFAMKEATTFGTTYFSALKEGYSHEEALEMAKEKSGEALPQSLVEAGFQGVGNFLGLILSKGALNGGWGTGVGTVFSNFASLGYALIKAEDSEARKAVLEEKLWPTIFGSTGALVSVPIPFISGNTGSILATDIYQVGKWIHDYDDIGDFAADVSGAEVGSKILGTTGAVVGDLIEYAIFHKTTGILSSILSTGGSLGGQYLGEFGENLGYWYYDYVQVAEDFGEYIADTGVAGFTDCWKTGFSDIMNWLGF